MSDLATSYEVEDEEPESLPTSVYRTTWGNRFFVQIRREGKLRYLGSYTTVEEAVQVRDAARRQLGS